MPAASERPASGTAPGAWFSPAQTTEYLDRRPAAEARDAAHSMRRRERGVGPRVLVIDCAGCDSGRGMAALARDLLVREGVQATVLRLGSTPESIALLVRSWVSAHGVLICTPASELEPGGALAQAIDRLDCSAGMSRFPDYLADRVYGVAVSGNTLLAEATRRALAGRLDRMGLVDSGTFAQLDRHAGYFEPAEAAEAVCSDTASFVEQVENVALAVCRGVRDLCAGRVPRLGRPHRTHHFAA